MNNREQLLAQIRSTCKHFTGLVNDHCAAGVAYDGVKDRSTRPFGIPCLKSRPCGTECPTACYPTHEEAEAELAEGDLLMERVIKIRAAIVEATAHKWGGTQGEIPCPCCEGGTVSYSVSNYNGHIRAKCSTLGCVEWVE